jgi:uncharacterized protein
MSEIEIVSAILGSTIGIILALTGAGGAMLAIPLLVFFLDLTIYQAAPIALLAVFLASSIGAIQGLSKGFVRYKAALLIATIGMMVAPLGVKLAQQASDQLLSLTLVLILLFISFRSWKMANRKIADNSHLSQPACMINPATSRLFWTASCTKRLVGTGMLAGILSGLLGVGGGFVIMPSLNKVSNLNNQTIIATTLAAVSLITISSITSHIQFSVVNWHIAMPFTASTILAMFICSETINTKISKQISQKGFAFLCLVAAIHLSIKNLA